MTVLDKALSHLNDLIGLGVEYPQAHWRACTWYTLSTKQGNTLQKMYDNQ